MVVLGATTATAHPPAGLALLALVGPGAALFTLRRTSQTGPAMIWGLAYGIGLFAALLSWSVRFGVAAYAALVVSQALFFLPVAAVAAARLSRLRWIGAVTATWVVAEFARARWPLGGFEWGQLGYAWHDTPVRGLAAWAGVLGLTGATVAVAALAAETLARRSVPRVAPAVAVFALVGLAATPSWTSPAGGLDVTVVQIAPVCEGPVVYCADEDARVLDAFANATRRRLTGAELVIWGEGALGAGTIAQAGVLASGAADLRGELLAGVTAPAGRSHFVNANVLFDRNGRVIGEYRKRHPVPFGEYVPARSLLGGVGGVGQLVPADLARGRDVGVIEVHGAKVGTVSSFETSFAREGRAAAGRDDVQALIVLTSEASYGRSAVSDQLLAMAQLRAAELNKAVVVAATTGRSAVFDASGALLVATDLLSPAVMDAAVPLRTGVTPFGMAGDAPLIVAAGVTLIAAVPPVRRLRLEHVRPPTFLRRRTRPSV